MSPIEAVRQEFERDAEPYGFDLTRTEALSPEPWAEYKDAATGHRWGGFLAARSNPSLPRGEHRDTEVRTWGTESSSLRDLLKGADLCYSQNDGDTWFDCPDDWEIVEGMALGDEVELMVSVRSVRVKFKVTKAPDDEGDDYEVEPIIPASNARSTGGASHE